GEATAACAEAAHVARQVGPGDFISIASGIAYGRYGQREAVNTGPGNLGDALVVNALERHEAIRRLSEFGNDLFAVFAPRTFQIASSETDRLFGSTPSLIRGSVGPWTACTFDLGPQTVTRSLCGPSIVRKLRYIFQHAPWCWISVTALGDFDPDLGRHLILWDLARVLRFPPGTTVLLPGVLRYSIAKIQAGETRYSFTQY
ncbi:hypothetical protein DFH06DRAFT_910643, partial [Mycena polygramma]